MSRIAHNGKRPDESEVSLAAQLQAKWTWFVALGVLILAAGVGASLHVLTATLASVVFVGTLMLFAGVGMLIHAWRIRGLAGFVLWTLSGVLYLAAGVFTFYDPISGAQILTLLLGATLIGSGAFRLWVWFQNRAQQGWQWLALSALATLLAGLLIASGWPGNSVWVLGMLLSIDLILQGVMLITLGMALKRRS